MKYLFLPLLLCLFLFNNARSQEIYSKAYGNHSDPAIIFIHGGPRGNSSLFEGTTAPLIAKKGFYVIVYDRRGEGRSIDTSAKINFAEAITDLDQLMEKYNIKKATLIGHSFGGIVATLYTSSRPEKVERLILVGALFAQQETYDHILISTEKLALAKRDTASLNQISLIRSLDHKSADYRKRCYDMASKFGYFSMPHPTSKSQQLELDYQNSQYGKMNIRNNEAPLRFYKNEQLVNINTKDILKNIKKKGIKLFGIYGKQDRIFSDKQLRDIGQLIGTRHFDLIDNCSHYPFIDQQQLFINDIVKFMM
ncbi:alpha/beta fold hydrolase [Pedobacter vanadiisoli]|uniref:Alpha/beta fold hydrolase n=1 Tax=Pedobacter vanadiisoli TaxID=1761975 RepID=A0ABW5MNS4_9SPHI